MSRPHCNGCRDLGPGWVSKGPGQLMPGEDEGASASEVQRSSLCSSGARPGQAVLHCSLSGWQSAHTAAIGTDTQQFGPDKGATIHFLCRELRKVSLQVQQNIPQIFFILKVSTQ